MIGGAAAFNKAASASYKELDEITRERLEELAAVSVEKQKQMTVKDVRRAASKSFSKIRREVQHVIMQKKYLLWASKGT